MGLNAPWQVYGKQIHWELEYKDAAASQEITRHWKLSKHLKED